MWWGMAVLYEFLLPCLNLFLLYPPERGKNNFLCKHQEPAFTWWDMVVLYEFLLPWAGHRSCQGLVELSCLWIKAGRGHANKIAPERLALVQHDGIFFLNSSCIFLFIEAARSCIWVELPSLFAGSVFVVLQEAGGMGNIG